MAMPGTIIFSHGSGEQFVQLAREPQGMTLCLRALDGKLASVTWPESVWREFASSVNCGGAKRREVPADAIPFLDGQTLRFGSYALRLTTAQALAAEMLLPLYGTPVEVTIATINAAFVRAGYGSNAGLAAVNALRAVAKLAGLIVSYRDRAKPNGGYKLYREPARASEAA